MSEGTVEELQEKVHQLEESLRKVKSVDELTGLYNRNTYYDRVRCRFENEPDREYVIVCFDVEKFKFVNDRFGLKVRVARKHSFSHFHYIPQH